MKKVLFKTFHQIYLNIVSAKKFEYAEKFIRFLFIIRNKC